MNPAFEKFLKAFDDSGMKIILLHHPAPKPDSFRQSDFIIIDSIPPLTHYDIPKLINTRTKDQLL
jgi:hypothetical protein